MPEPTNQIPRCPPQFGCDQQGWLWDACDSGSGAQVYCDCPFGTELRARDAEDDRQHDALLASATESVR
jgi:hypothetical protein